MTLEIRKRSKIPAAQWNALVESSADGWLWHLHDLPGALSLWYGKTDLSFGIMDKGGDQLLALFPLCLVERRLFPLVNIRRLESLGGPIVASRLAEKTRAILDHMTAHVESIKKKYGIWQTSIYLSPVTPSLTGSIVERINPLLTRGYQDASTHSWVLDLRTTKEEIFSRYSKNTRNEIRSLLDKNPTVREADGAGDLDAYYELHCETYRRTKVRPHPRGYFQVIFEKCIPGGLARVLFLEREGQLVAAQNTALYKGRAYYWTGASRAGRSGSETKLLCHLQIMHAKDQGFDFYDMGEAHPMARSGRARGLSDFKKRFGGELYPFYKGIRFSDSMIPRVMAYTFESYRNFQKI